MSELASNPQYIDSAPPPWTGRDPAAYSAKQAGGNFLRMEALSHSLNVSFQDKGFDVEAINFLASNSSLKELTLRFLTRLIPQDGRYKELNDKFTNSEGHPYDGNHPYSYEGTESQNQRIDDAYKGLTHYARGEWNPAGDIPLSGFGATRYFNSQEVKIAPEVRDILEHTPVVILGSGAAGILTAYGLSEMGFSDITIIDKKKKREEFGHKRM